MRGHRRRRGLVFFVVALGLPLAPSPGWPQEPETTDTQLWLEYSFHGYPKTRLTTSLDLGYRQVARAIVCRF